MKQLVLAAFLILTTAGNASAGIGVSYDQLMRNFARQFTMEKGVLKDGSLRYLGRGPDRISYLELVGPKNDLSRATFLFSMPKDSPAANENNIAQSARFVKITAPEWPGGRAWVSGTFQEFMAGSEKQSITKGRKLITMEYIRSLRWVSISVEKI